MNLACEFNEVVGIKVSG